MNTTQISAAKLSALVAFYNLHVAAHGGTPVAKFADRKTAERRVAVLAAKVEAAQAEAAKAARAPKVPAKKAPATTNVKRAEAISKSWQDPAVASARAERTKVVVDGTPYPSVRQAFFALGLPDSKHIKFRLELKRNGKASILGRNFKIAA